MKGMLQPLTTYSSCLADMHKDTVSKNDTAMNFVTVK